MSNAFTMTLVMENGERHTVRTNLRDQLRYEETARKGKWGPLTDNLLRYETFTAWSAARRAGIIPDAQPYEQFADTVEQIDSEVISPRPTTPEPSTGST